MFVMIFFSISILFLVFLSFLQGVAPFLGATLDELKPPHFSSVHNGLFPSASSFLGVGPFPNVLKFPMVLFLSLVRLLIN